MYHLDKLRDPIIWICFAGKFANSFSSLININFSSNSNFEQGIHEPHIFEVKTFGGLPGSGTFRYLRAHGENFVFEDKVINDEEPFYKASQ